MKYSADLARQESAPTPKIAIKMILSLFGRLISVKVLMGITKIHISRKMFVPAFTNKKVSDLLSIEY